MNTNTWIMIIFGVIVNAVIFGVGAIFVLSLSALNANAKYLIPAGVVISFALMVPLASIIAKLVRLRNWGKAQWKKGARFRAELLTRSRPPIC